MEVYDHAGIQIWIIKLNLYKKSLNGIKSGFETYFQECKDNNKQMGI